MVGQNKVAFAADGNHSSEEGASSSVLPHVEQECLGVEMKSRNVEEESETLKIKADTSTSKDEPNGFLKVLRNRGHQRNQLLPSKDGLSVLGKKMVIQETDLRRANKLNDALKQELKSTRKNLQTVKQGTLAHRAKQQNLNDQMDQVVRERDDLNVKWRRCKTDCSELHDRITDLQSSLNKKDNLCKEQRKLIHVLQQEKEKLVKEMNVKENDAEEQSRSQRKCEEELRIHRRKLKRIKICREIEDELGVLLLETSPTPQQPPQLIRKSARQTRLESVESLQKKLQAQTEELRATLKTSEELKQKLTQVAAQLQRCQVTVRDQKEKLQAVTAQRNMYQSVAKNMELEVALVKEGYRREKLKNGLAKRRNEARLPRRDPSTQDAPIQVQRRTRDKAKLPSIPSEVHQQCDLRIVGTKIETVLVDVPSISVH